MDQSCVHTKPRRKGTAAFAENYLRSPADSVFLLRAMSHSMWAELLCRDGVSSD